MKKYLMTGIAALALCAGFTACSHDDFSFNEEDYVNSQKAQIEAQYQQAFVNAFGQPAKNHTWGFGQYATTRALSDEGITTGANKNRNLWAATDNIFKLLVPTPLSEGQRNRVRAYFQQNRYLTWEQPDMTDYFVQQVYTGGTNTEGSLSKETYTSGNGASVTGGQHMDYLTIGGVHVLDFNAANNVNTATDVKDNGTLTNDNKYHSDQITLMVGVTPTNVGFKVSDGSVQHIDHMALVSAKEIDDWAKKEENYVNGKVIGEDVWYGKDKDGYDNSFWNRSFVGLDYEQVPASDAFATVAYNDPTPVYVKVDEIQPGYIWDSVTNTILSKAEYKAQYNTEYLLDKDGNKIPWLVANTNEFLADPANFPSQDSYMPRIEIRTGYTDQVLDIQKIYAKVADNCYPVSTKQLQEWMKNVGGRDYYYSDWIVTLAPAQKINIPDVKKVRVICEDLNAQLGGYKGDFDFNDAVFDLYLDANDKVTEIELLWTGAEFDIEVDGKEIHDCLGVPKRTFSTTIGSYKFVPSAGAGEWSPSEVPVKAFRSYEVTDENGQKKTVNADIDLNAVRGKAPGKILVNPDFQWPAERQPIDEKYTKFPQYVNDENVDWQTLEWN